MFLTVLADSSGGSDEVLKGQIAKLEKDFSAIRIAVYKLVRTEPVDVFIAGLISMNVDGEVHHVPFLKEIADKNEIIKIWMELSPYLNFMNYEILDHLLQHFPDADLQMRMNKYTTRIESFFRSTKLCDFLKCWPIRGKTPPEKELRKFLSVKTKTDWRTCTLHHLDHLTGSLTRKLLLPKFGLILADASRGCVNVTYSIPTSMVAHLQTYIKNKLQLFVDMDIETIAVDSVVCYEAPLLQYTTHLKQLYTSSSTLQPLTDYKPIHLLQFRLAKIEKWPLTQIYMDKFTRESLRGDMDDVVYKKRAMELSELGVMPDSSQPEVVLIEGAPGVGKTTFAWDQCRQWAEGKLLQDYTIVLLLPLRDNNIRQITSLPSLFQHSNRQVSDEVIRTVTDSNGIGCLIWLEGWDELVDDLRSDSLLTELIRGTQLPAATIYITSRPWATGGLLELMRDRISQHAELLALAKEQVNFQKREIFEQLAFTSTHTPTTDTEETAKPLIIIGFLQYIESHPLILAAMYTPVTTAIVEQVFKSAPHNPPTTVTQLYSAYVLMRLEQYLTEHSKYSDMKIKVRTLADLPEEVLANFKRLCGLAYEGVSQRMTVFSSLPEGVSTLGLLQSVPQVYNEGEDQVSYNFLHYTVQEYLAALHLSQLQPQEQMVIVDTKCLRIEYGSSYYETTQFKTTFQFLAGITKLETYSVDFLSELLSEDEATVYSWLYESQNLPLLTSVLGSGERELSLHYSATPTDYFVAGYCLAHSKCTWIMNFDFISVVDVAIEFLSKGCNHQLSETDISCKIVSASFVQGSITADGVEHFLTVPNSLLQHIQYLSLIDNKLDRRPCDLLAEGVQKMPCLQTLRLNFNSGVGCGGAVQLVSSLHSSKLRELHMCGTGISDPDFECLASYIHSTTSLQKLHIGGNDISIESIASLLCRALSDNSSMRSLDMNDCHLTTSHCECLGQLLRHPIHCKIEWLDLSYCSLTSDGVGELVSGLSDNHTLRVLNLSGNQIRSDGAVAIATMLKTNSSLEILYLDSCSIDTSGGVELGAALERNKTLRVLWLSRNALGDVGVRGLCVGLENNSSLQSLDLRFDKSLGEEGVSLLLMKKSKNLQVCLPKFERPKKPPFLYGDFEGIYMYMYMYSILYVFVLVSCMVSGL